MFIHIPLGVLATYPALLPGLLGMEWEHRVRRGCLHRAVLTTTPRTGQAQSPAPPHLGSCLGHLPIRNWAQFPLPIPTFHIIHSPLTDSQILTSLLSLHHFHQGGLVEMCIFSPKR